MLLNKNEIGFVHLVRLLDSTIDLSVELDDTLKVDDIRLADLLDEDFKLERYMHSEFDSEKALFDYIETVDIPKEIEDDEEAVEEYLIQKENEYEAEVIRPKGLSYELYMEGIDNTVGKSIIATLRTNFTFGVYYSNEHYHKCFIDYDKMALVLSSALKYIKC